MREPIAQPLTLDGALVTVRNGSPLLNALGLRGLTLADFPPGWGMCDGTQGTPDLRDRFIVGARSHKAARDAHLVTLTQIIATQNETALKLAVCLDRNKAALEDCTLELRRCCERNGA